MKYFFRFKHSLAIAVIAFVRVALFKAAEH